MLVLEPGAPGEEIYCHLVHAELCWITSFEALSYCWGDATTTRQQTCSGHEVNVTVNLHNALTDLRYPDKKRVLWVDCLCIDQKDNAEKSKQVRLMSEIYSQVRQSLINLGPSDSSVQGAIELLRHLDWKYIPYYVAEYIQFMGFKWVTYHFPALIDTMPPPPQDVKYGRIINLLHRPWFQRVWVVQEAGSPKNGQVICGNESIPWHILEGFSCNEKEVRYGPGSWVHSETRSKRECGPYKPPPTR